MLRVLVSILRGRALIAFEVERCSMKGGSENRHEQMGSPTRETNISVSSHTKTIRTMERTILPEAIRLNPSNCQIQNAKNLGWINVYRPIVGSVRP